MLSSLFVVVCIFLLVGKGNLVVPFPLRIVGVVKASRCKVDMAVYGLLFHMLLWMDVALSMDVGFSSLRCCVFARELKL